MKKVNVMGPGKLKQATVKKVRSFGGTRYICLPKAYCESLNITPGTSMSVTKDWQDLRISPIMKEG